MDGWVYEGKDEMKWGDMSRRFGDARYPLLFEPL
jgi:hypothetical protein